MVLNIFLTQRKFQVDYKQISPCHELPPLMLLHTFMYSSNSTNFPNTTFYPLIQTHMNILCIFFTCLQQYCNSWSNSFDLAFFMGFVYLIQGKLHFIIWNLKGTSILLITKPDHLENTGFELSIFFKLVWTHYSHEK